MILHMSDFHIKDDSYSDAVEILNALAEYLKNNNYVGKIEYVVNTGDFIDQYVIVVNLIACLRKKYPALEKEILAWENNLRRDYSNPDEYRQKHDNDYTKRSIEIINGIGEDVRSEYNAELINACKISFGKAKGIFCDFLKRIEVTPDKAIVSCGNHDRMWLAGSKDCECDGKTFRCGNLERYLCFEEFCKETGFTYLNSKNPFYDKDSKIIFVGFDSVSPSPTTNERYCSECLSIDKTAILNHSNNKKIISVTHKPIGDYCDNSKEEYDEARTYSFRAFLQSHVRLMLNGDKHGFSNEGNSILCGSPLNKTKRIRYSLINTDTWENVPIKYSGGDWSFDDTIENLSSIYDVSKKNIQDSLTNDFLNRGQYNSIQDLIFLSRGNISEQLSTIFKAEGEYRIKGNRGETIDLWKEDNFFNFLYNRIVASKSPNPINIRGTRGSDKSTLLIELYCFIIRKIYRGDNNIVPFYISLRSSFSVTGHKEPSELIGEAKKALQDLVKNARDKKSVIKKINNRARLLFIIDGLDEFNFYGAEGDKLCDFVHDLCIDIEDNKEAFILSINQYKICSSIDKTDWKYGENSDLLYLDPIYLEPITVIEKNKTQAFFKAINMILRDNGCCEASSYYVSKAGRVTADLGIIYFLFGNKDMYMDTTNPIYEDKWYQVQRCYDLVKKKIQWDRRKDDEKVKLEKAAYDYAANESFDYSTPSATACTANEFQMIIGNELIRNALCAEYFLRLFKEGRITEWKPFVTHDLALFIFVAISSKYRPNDPNSLRNFLKKIEDKLEGLHSAQLLSVLIYIIGQFGSSQMEENRRDSLITMLSKNALIPTSFASHCLNRSESIAFAYIHSSANGNDDIEPSQSLEKLISEVVFNIDDRRFDRVFLLNYYGDASNNYKSIDMLVNCEYTESFDFDLTIRSLKKLLRDKNNPVYLYNAFMMASFVKSRLSVKNNSSGAQLTHPFFFKEKYSEQDLIQIKAVLELAIDSSKKAYSLADNAFVSDKIRAAYKASLYEMIQLFEDCFKEYDIFITGVNDVIELQHNIATRAHPSYEFEKLKNLEYYGRSCWDYMKNPKPNYTTKKVENLIINNNIKYYANPHFETVLEHIYETMLLAFLYLPENNANEKYSKKDIISIIFMHEFGVAENGDIPQDARRYNEIKIKDTERIAALWCNMYVSSNDSHDIYNMEYDYRTMTSGESINAIIARELGWIQREYKRKSIVLENEDKTNDLRWMKPLKKTSLTNEQTRKIFEMLIENNPLFDKLR